MAETRGAKSVSAPPKGLETAKLKDLKVWPSRRSAAFHGAVDRGDEVA